MENLFRLIDQVLEGKPIVTSLNSLYDYNIEKSENEYILEVLVPGYKKEDLEISFERSYLTISHKRKTDEKIVWKKSFEKKFYVSDDLSKESISAKLEDGVLKITLKRKEETKPSKITIE